MFRFFEGTFCIFI